MIKNNSIMLIVMLFFCSVTSASAQCISGCNDNTYLNAVNPNTIEYDNMVSAYHSSMAKKTNQEVYIWGENSKPDGSSNFLTPTLINVANGFNYTGTILKFTGVDYGQNAILTTTGLYIWGHTNYLVSTQVKNSSGFGAVALGTVGVVGTKADGLPAGVSPTDVKMMFGSEKTLAITTCTGQAWILSASGEKNGDGTSQSSTNDKIWHRIRISSNATDFLTNVVAVRGSANAMMALTSTGKVYTWGTGTYLGNGSNSVDRIYATEMTLPAGVSVKMIGMTSLSNTVPYQTNNTEVSYYLLSTTGSLYSLGNNDDRQLGDFTTNERKSWVRVHKPNSVVGGSTDSGSFMDNIAWFSPTEHDYRYASVSALTSAGELYSWGSNSSEMLGTASNPSNPTYQPGGLTATDKILAVENGGHTTITFKQCSLRFGYVGHRVNGSMGDGTTVNAQENTYNFTNTPQFNLCGAPTAPTVKNLKTCPGSTVNLLNAQVSTPFTGTTFVTYTTSNGDPSTKIQDPTSVGPGTYYAFYEGNCPSPAPSDAIIVSYYAAGDPQYGTCPDSDKDGVDDFTDLDDDNDGILDSVEAPCNSGPLSITKAPTAAGVTQNFPNFNATYKTLSGNNATLYSSAGFNGYDLTAFGKTEISFSPNILNLKIRLTDLDTGEKIRVYAYDVNGALIPNIFSYSSGPTSRVQLSVPTGVSLLVENTFGTNTPSFDPTTTVDFNFNIIISKIVFDYYATTTGSPELFMTDACAVRDTDGDGVPDYLDLDSDNDGCTDAIEGDENVTNAQLVTAVSPLTVGVGSTALNQNLGNVVDAQGVPTVVNSGGAADIGNNQGQGVGSSINAAINTCICYNDPNTATAGISSNHGITLLQKAGAGINEWPMIRKSAHTVLESNTKGFVITRMTTTQITAIASPQEGMLVYDTTLNCMKLYDGTTWSCFNTPTCP